MANDAQSPSFTADGAQDCRFFIFLNQFFRQKCPSDLTPFLLTVQEAVQPTGIKRLQRSRPSGSGWSSGGGGSLRVQCVP